MADDEKATEESGGGSKKMLIIGVVGGLILIGGGIFAGPMIKEMISPTPPTEEAGEAEAEEAPAGADAIYQGIHPPLLINFTDDRGKGRFLQISLELMTRDQAVVDAVKAHGAVIRNNLILSYGDISYQDVTSREGKARMLEDALGEINNILLEQTGKGGVEAVYFTNLVVQ